MFQHFSRKGPTLGHSKSTLFQANVSMQKCQAKLIDKKTVRQAKTEFNNYPNPLEKRNITSVPSQSSSSAVRLVECWSWPLKRTAQETSERRRYWYHVLKGKSSSRPQTEALFYGVYTLTVPGKYMGVSKNRGTPKWMVYSGKPYWNGWFWGYPFFSETPIWGWSCYRSLNLHETFSAARRWPLSEGSDDQEALKASVPFN